MQNSKSRQGNDCTTWIKRKVGRVLNTRFPLLENLFFNAENPKCDSILNDGHFFGNIINVKSVLDFIRFVQISRSWSRMASYGFQPHLRGNHFCGQCTSAYSTSKNEEYCYERPVATQRITTSRNGQVSHHFPMVLNMQLL